MKDAHLNCYAFHASSKHQAVHRNRIHDLRNSRISLKQWRILHAVVDCGGFAGAAQFLNISQSAISYTIAKLQEQLGVPLLKMEGRKARITEHGRLLLERSRHLIQEALELEEFAERIGQGQELTLRLLADHHFPNDLLMSALRDFLIKGRMVTVCLSEVSKQLAGKALANKTADLVICNQMPEGYLGDPLIDVEYIAVAHPEHALFKRGRDISVADLQQAVQIIIRSTEESDRRRPTPLHAPIKTPCWSVSSVDAAVMALHERVGFAWMAKHQVQQLLEQGALKAVPLSQGRSYRTTFYLIRNHQSAHDAGVAKLAETLHGIALSASIGAQSHLAKA